MTDSTVKHPIRPLCLVFMVLLCAPLAALSRGDFNHDGWVNMDDLVFLADHWLTLHPFGCPDDPTEDCPLTIDHLSAMSRHWQTLQCSPIAAAASSWENASLSAQNAVDGTLTTRWSSAFADNQWLELDMGQIRTVVGLQIFWEYAYASKYNIQTSVDQHAWTLVYTQDNADGHLDDITFVPVTARYIRINCIERATPYGSSIYEVFVKTDDDCLPAGDWELVWADEFEGPNVNPDNWTFETGTGSNGWGNGEWQYYTARPENVRIENNNLVIEARQETYGNRNYTSARLKTQAKQTVQYGRIEARIKMPLGGQGIWPAFWMLGDNITSVGWPRCGEIDIVEMMSNSLTDNRKATTAIHYAGANGSHTYQSGSRTIAEPLSQQFRIYAIEWDPSGISWYLDNVRYYARSSWVSSEGPFPAPFNKPFFILLNFAVGSSWWDREITEATVPFPQTLVVDYVRVYRKNL